MSFHNSNCPQLAVVEVVGRSDMEPFLLVIVVCIQVLVTKGPAKL